MPWDDEPSYGLSAFEGPSSQASSLDTAQPWAYAHVSGLGVRGTVCPRTSCLQHLVRGSDRPDNGLSEPYDRMCAIDRLRRGRAAVVCSHDHKCVAVTTKILLDRVRDESGERPTLTTGLAAPRSPVYVTDPVHTQRAISTVYRTCFAKEQS